MSIRAHLSMLSIMLACVGHAQVSIPANPGKFKVRPVGDATSGGVQVLPKDGGGKVRHVTHIVLSESRYWTSAEGNPLEAKLIAFEDIVVETAKGAAAPPMTPPTGRPTVVRDGKVRLLAKQKAYTLALDRLSRQDREFIADIQAAIDKKTKAIR